jgi:site-specific DNA-methyltransferase (adenine-specific)
MLDFGFYNIDCMQGMKEFPDKYFDLAIVDPPYGGGGDIDAENTFNGALVGRFDGRFEKYFGNDKRGHMGGGHTKKFGYGHWDIAPDEEYFKELFRVSKNQIIWGGNYFALPPTRCFVIWRKLTISENFTMAMAEYAWASFNENAKVFEYAPQDKNRIHPTQKPVALYEWLLGKYAKDGDIILDTHVGSASSLIACHRTRHNFVGFEIDETYYKQAKERLDAEIAQMTIFDFMEK